MNTNILNKKSFSINTFSFFKSLFQLMKPRVMSLVIFTCAVGLLTSPNKIPLFDSLICILFVTIGAGAAGALNMWYEADLDKLMTRTCLRPIPTGKITKDQSLTFGILFNLLKNLKRLYEITCIHEIFC